MNTRVTFTKTEFDFYGIKIDGKAIGATIDKKPNGKFGIYDTKEKCYFGIENGTLSECKKFIEELYY